MDKYVKVEDTVALFSIKEECDLDLFDTAKRELFRRRLEEKSTDRLVEVTRCENCEHGKRQTRGTCSYVICTADEDHPTCAPDWFCPRGKPKEK